MIISTQMIFKYLPECLDLTTTFLGFATGYLAKLCRKWPSTLDPYLLIIKLG